jgi:integrase
MGDRSGIRARSASSVEIDFYYRGVRCRERVKLEPTDRNLKYCQRWKARIEDEIAKNEFDYAKHFPDSAKVKFFSRMPGDSVTVESYLLGWLDAEKKNVKHSTWKGYDKIVRGHLISGFGKLCLTDLRRKHVKDWEDLHPTMTPKTLGNVLSPLRIALDDAVRNEFIEHNPLAGYKIKRRRGSGVTGKNKARQIDPFAKEEREAILGKLDGQGFNLVQFAFWTGLRTSELCALDWADVDWLRGMVRVSRALTQGAPEPEEPKTKAGLRDVKLLPPALEALKAQKARTYLKNKEVFQDPRTGERWTGDQAIRKTLWSPALKKAGVRYRNPYQTRHTYASMMLMAGEHIMWVSKQLGHTN